MYIPAQIQLKMIEMMEIEPESAVPILRLWYQACRHTSTSSASAAAAARHPRGSAAAALAGFGIVRVTSEERIRCGDVADDAASAGQTA